MAIAQPEDHQSSTFNYKFASGKSVTLPRFKSVMTFGRARKLRSLDEAEQMFTLIEDICDGDALDALDSMNTSETEAFFAAWQEDSGVSVGESSA